MAALLATWAPSVLAHAELVRSDPPAGAVLSTAPAQVRLWFSEQIEAEFNALTVTDRAGNPQDVGNAQVASEDVRQLRADLRPLDRGSYTVRWRVISADSHVVAGVFQFSVGAPSAEGSAGQETATSGATPQEAGLRWLSLVAMAVLVGAFFFRQSVLVPSRASLPASGPLPQILVEAEGRTLVVARWAALGVLVLSLVALLYQVVQVGGGTLLQAFDPSLVSRVVMRTRYGTVWLARMALLVGLMGVLDQMVVARSAREEGVASGASARGGSTAQPRALRAEDLWWWLGALLGAALLLTTSLTSHASGRDPVALAVLADWLHLLATATWIGGVLHVVLLLQLLFVRLQPQERAEFLRAVFPPLSRVAVVSVQALLATGFFSAWLNVVAVSNLTTTPYGNVLLLKLGLVAALLALGAVNLLVLGPRFERWPVPGGGAGDGRRLAGWAATTLRAEAALGVGVLLIVGVLGSTPPAPLASAGSAASASSPLGVAGLQGITLAQGASETLVVLRVTPAEIGQNTLFVTLRDNVGQPVQDAQVEVRVGASGASGADLIALTPKEEGYAAVAELRHPGVWEFEVRVRRPGKPQETAPLSLSLPLPGARQLLAEADAAMNRLAGLKERQQLRGGPGSAGVMTEYLFAAPDRVAYKVTTGAQTVIIGQTRYDFFPDRGWSKLDLPAELRYSFPDFRLSDITAEVAVLGRELVDGVESDVVGFHQPASGAYFRAWIGVEDRLMRKLAMMAPGHFMTSTYSDFNMPNTILPPP